MERAIAEVAKSPYPYPSEEDQQHWIQHRYETIRGPQILVPVTVPDPVQTMINTVSADDTLNTAEKLRVIAEQKKAILEAQAVQNAKQAELERARMQQYAANELQDLQAQREALLRKKQAVLERNKPYERLHDKININQAAERDADGRLYSEMDWNQKFSFTATHPYWRMWVRYNELRRTVRAHIDNTLSDICDEILQVEEKLERLTVKVAQPVNTYLTPPHVSNAQVVAENAGTAQAAQQDSGSEVQTLACLDAATTPVERASLPVETPVKPPLLKRLRKGFPEIKQTG